MGIVFRQSAKNLIVVGFGAMLGALIIWLSTKYIPRQQYGFVGTLTTYAVTFSQMLLLGINSTLVVYIHRFAEDPRKRKLLITISLALPLLTAAVLTVLAYVLKPALLTHFQPVDIPFMERYFMLIPLFTMIFMYMVLLEQFLGSQLKVAVAAFMREVVLRVLNIVLIVLFGWGKISFHTLVIVTVLIYFIPLLIFLLLAMRTKVFGISFMLNDFSKAEYKEMSHFAWYHFLLATAGLLLSSMDMLLIPLYDHNGLSSIAVYRIAIFLISFLQMPFRALVPASFTVLAKAFTDGDSEKARDLFVRSSINILIPTVFIAALLFSNLTNVMAVIKNGYSEIAPLFAIMFVGNITTIVLGMADQVLSITNYYKFNFYLSLVLMGLLFLVLRAVIPVYGIYGAAWCTSLTMVLASVIKFVFIYKRLGIKIYFSRSVMVLLAGAAALAVGHFFPHLLDQSRHTYVRTFADVIIRSTVVVAVYLALLLWLQPSADLKEYISQVKKNKRLF
jgi:O-antigen/teichoic acid export membrane protein